MQLTEKQKETILKIADFLEERNEEDIIYYNRADYRFAYYSKDSEYHDNFNNDIMEGFKAFYDISRDNEFAFYNNSELFRQILEKETPWSEQCNEIWNNFIEQLDNDKDFDDAIEYALMLNVVFNEKSDLYTLKELAELLRDYEQQYDIERILLDVIDEYSWRMDNKDAVNELEDKLWEEDEDYRCY